MTTTNNDNIELAVTAIQEALKEVKRMNYVLAIKATLIRMLDECERLQALGADTTEMVNLIQTIFDFTTYITDTPDEVPNA
jgi:ribulose 1,5-bisphosphate carboxylase large subunit-like protein